MSKTMASRLERIEQARRGAQAPRVAPVDFWRALIPGDPAGESMRGTHRHLLPDWSALVRRPGEVAA